MDKVREAIRVVGYLLETNGITDRIAINQDYTEVPFQDPSACKFCLLGASYVVGSRLGVNYLQDRVGEYLSLKCSLVSFWDNAGHKGRKWAVDRLKSA